MIKANWTILATTRSVIVGKLSISQWTWLINFYILSLKVALKWVPLLLVISGEDLSHQPFNINALLFRTTDIERC